MTPKELKQLLAVLVTVLRTAAITALAWAAGYFLTKGGWSPLAFSDHGAVLVVQRIGDLQSHARHAGFGFAALALAACIWKDLRE